jgi:small GTP-binding protein
MLALGLRRVRALASPGVVCARRHVIDSGNRRRSGFARFFSGHSSGDGDDRSSGRDGDDADADDDGHLDDLPRRRPPDAFAIEDLFVTGDSGSTSDSLASPPPARTPPPRVHTDRAFLAASAGERDKTVLKMRRWDRKDIRRARLRELRVALVGRPNVGKSTLFNRLTREKDAIIHHAPGTTRDWRVGHGQLGDLQFSVIDTGGLEEGPPSSMRGQIVAQCERAVSEANLVLFMLDARAGVVDTDLHFASWLRRLSGSGNFTTQLVLNKAEVCALCVSVCLRLCACGIVVRVCVV